MTIADLKVKILDAALALAEKNGYQEVTRDLLARKLFISAGAVSYHWHDMSKLRAAVVRAAIERENVAVLAHAITARHPYVKDIPDELRQRVARTLAHTT